MVKGARFIRRGGPYDHEQSAIPAADRNKGEGPTEFGMDKLVVVDVQLAYTTETIKTETETETETGGGEYGENLCRVHHYRYVCLAYEERDRERPSLRERPYIVIETEARFKAELEADRYFLDVVKGYDYDDHIQVKLITDADLLQM